MAKKVRTLGRKSLSLLLTLSMVIGLMNVTAFATETFEDQVMPGYYTIDANGEQGVAPEGVDSVTEDGYTLTKTIEQTGVDQFDITLTVQTSQTVTTSDAAVQLVIDISTSMKECSEGCGKSSCKHDNRLQAIQKILAQEGGFLDSLEESNTGRLLVSVVAFNADAITVADWADITTESGMNTVRTAINSLASSTMGTNIQAGLMLARNRLGMDDVKNAGAKYTVLLSDGEAHHKSNESSSTERIDGSSWAQGDPASLAKNVANQLKEISSVYAVGYGVDKDYLEGIVGKGDHVLVGESSDAVSEAFANIAQTTTEGMNGAGTTVFDPMGEYILLGSVSSLSGEGVSETADGIKWNLDPAKAEKTTVNNVTTYTYSVTYPITLDTSAEGFVEDYYYATNGYTYLNVPQDDGSNKEIAFLIPGVKGQIPDTELLVTKVWDTNGKEIQVPESAMVQLYKDGEPEGEPVTLNAENDWSCHWTALDGASDWTVEEMDVPEGWEASYEADGTHVTVTNTYVNVGSLEITKIVEVDKGEAAVPGEASFTVKGPGYSKIVKYSQFVDGKLVLEDLPLGTYTVTENAASAQVEGYDLEITGSGDEIIVSQETPGIVTITNSYTSNYIPQHTTGTVTVIKTTLSGETPSEAGFQLQKLNGEAWENVGELISYGQFLDSRYTFTGLVEGEYRVVESNADVEGYDLSAEDDMTVTLVKTTADNGDTDVNDGELEITNSYTRQLGSLTIVKTANKTVPAGAEFTVSGDEFSDTITYAEFENGSYTFENIPVGTYTVTENADSARIEKFTLTVEGNNAEAEVVKGETASVTVNNLYTEIIPDTGSLKIVKTVSGLEGDDRMNPDTIFTITGPEGYNVSVKYSEFNGTTYHEINGLLAGELYTVVESGAETDGYNLLATSVTDGEAEITKDGVSEVEIINNYSKIYIPTHTLGEITVTKRADGGITPPTAIFQLQKLGEEDWQDVGEAVAFSLFENGRYTFTELTAGTYRVVESGAEIEGANLTVTNTQQAALIKNTSDLGDTSVSNGSILIENKYQQKTGSLKLMKSVTGLAEGVELPGEVSFDIYSVKGEEAVQVATVTYAEFENGEYVLENLPIGEYTVDENYVNVDGYLWKGRVIVYDGDTADLYATVTENGMGIAAITNRYEVPPAADLIVEKVADREVANVGDTITYTITVVNSGNATAEKVSITDTPDSSLKILEVSNGGVYADGEINWNNITLPAGISWEATVKAEVRSTSKTSVVNTAAVYEDGEKKDETSETVGLQAVLTISKSISGLDSETQRKLEDELSFTITGPNDYSETFSYKEDFAKGKLVLKDLEPGVYTIVENNAEVGGGYDLTVRATDSDEEAEGYQFEMSEGGKSTRVQISNNYVGRIYNIWFDAGNHGDVRNDNGNEISGVWRNLWSEMHIEEEGTVYEWAGFGLKDGWKVYQLGIDDTNNLYDDLTENYTIAEDSSVILYHFSWAEWVEFKNDMDESKPGLSVESGWKSDKEFYLNGGETAFTDFEAAVEFMNANAETTVDANGFYNAYYVALYENDPVPPYNPPSGGGGRKPVVQPDPEPDPIEVVLPDEDVPLADEPIIEIPEEEVPLAEVPKTGDESLMFLLMALISGAGMVCLTISGKKKEDELA